MGWRYLVITLGALTFLLAILRLFVFPLHESPRYLFGRGLDEDAVAVIHEIARYNGTKSGLTVEDLKDAGHSAERQEGTRKWHVLSESSVWTAKHVRSLFATKKMAWSTSLFIWISGMHSLSGICFDVLTRTVRHMIRTYRARIDTLQQFPTLYVGVHFHDLSVLSHIKY